MEYVLVAFPAVAWPHANPGPVSMQLHGLKIDRVYRGQDAAHCAVSVHRSAEGNQEHAHAQMP